MEEDPKKVSSKVTLPTEFFGTLSKIWTIVCMILMTMEFFRLRFAFTDHATQVTFQVVMLYLTVLTLYTAGIQRRKWHKLEGDGLRRGEWYLYTWWILALVFCIIHSVLGWKFPEMFLETLEGVTVIFAGGKAAKYIRLAKNKEKKK